MFYLIILLFYLIKKLNKIKEIKNKKNDNEKDIEIIYPFISIIIYCFSNDVENTIKSINYFQNKYEIIKITSFDNLSSKINKNSKFVFVINNNMLLTTDCIYDLIKFTVQNKLDSTHCLLSYPNYKDNIINNVYYHFKYLENMNNEDILFGKLISTKIVDKIGKTKIKSEILQKNLIIQNIPYISSIPNEISFYNKKSIDKYYLIEPFCLLFIFFEKSITNVLILSSLFWLYYFQVCNINYGINDFHFFQSIYLTVFKVVTLVFNLIDLITFNFFNKINYPELKYNSFIKPEYSDRVIYKNGYLYHLLNYNLDVVYLYGSHYEMGFTIGEIYKNELKNHIKVLDNYVPSIALNPLWKNMGYKAKTILSQIKDYSWKFISKENKDEIRGIAEGSNIDIDDIILITLFPSLSKAHCTILTDVNLFLRTLDIDLKSDKFALFVYQPNKFNQYTTLSLPGLNWCFTGFSDKLVIGEVFNDNCLISRNKFGSPFFLNFKDILMKSNNLDEAKEVIKKIKWHDSIDICVRSMNSNQNLFVEKRGNESIFYNNNNFYEYIKKYSKVEAINNKYSFYYNLDLMYNIINQYNKLSVNNLLNSIIIGLETGSNHSLILDFENKEFYISVNNTKKEGYQRQMVKFKISNILSTCE